MDFHNSVVLITGGASGIGEATTRYFVSLGAYVVVADQDTERGQKLAEEYRGKIDFYQADVGSEDQVKSLFDFIRQKHGVLDVLHNNAAYSLSKTLWDTTAEEWDKVMYVNLRGYFLCAKYAPDLLKKAAMARLSVPQANWESLTVWKALPTTPLKAAFCNL